MSKMILVFLGSGLGGALRYSVMDKVQRLAGATFPLGTLVVNLVGCFLIGFLGAALTGRILIREEYRIALIVGVLGGFTTFSAFGMETFAFLNNGQFARATANVLLSVVIGVSAVWIGYRLAQSWPGV